ncbi:MAG: crossover junction endodeoxyribonuclease RuvC [Pirellulaceae bacterium]|nr:crossover junction endodeoxyribonuclease RuvC [Pirellulaceae bacterium]
MVGRILGIDPALRTTGYGIIDVDGNKIRLVDAGVIRSTAQLPLEQRLAEIHQGICELLSEYQPTSLAIEELYSHYDRPTTAILMGHARGVIYLASAQANLTVHAYAATQIKKTLTGNGHAPKGQMQMAVKLQLGLRSALEPADVADAVAIALTHFHLSSTQTLIK